MKRAVSTLALGLVLGACSSRPCRPCLDPHVPHRQFLVLQARSIPDPQSGVTQVFVDGKVVSVPGREPVEVLDRAAPVAGTAAPVWLVENELRADAFGPRAREVNSPKLLAVDGQDATVSVREDNPDGSIHRGWDLSITPTVRSAQIQLAVAYHRYQDGRLVDSVPVTSVRGPAGRVFIIESRPTP